MNNTCNEDICKPASIYEVFEALRIPHIWREEDLDFFRDLIKTHFGYEKPLTEEQQSLRSEGEALAGSMYGDQNIDA